MPGFNTIGFVVVPVLLAVAGTYATPFQKRGLNQVISQCKHNFAYTFDGGPTSLDTTLVDKLGSVHGKTTFFVNGDRYKTGVSCIYSKENVKAMRYGFEHGHQYASNTWSYADLTKLTEAKIDEEIRRLDEAFVKILGVKPKFLHPPLGSIDARTASYIQTKHGKTIVLPDRDPGVNFSDLTDSNTYIDFFQHLATESANPTHLTISNVFNPISIIIAFGSIVDILHNAGITLLTVAGCLDLQPYEHVGKYGTRDNTWTCNGTWTPSSVE